MRSEWPSLHYSDWSDTCETLHMWTQIVGKIRMEKTPPINHWWHVVLYVTSRGLGTSPIPDGNRTFDIDFDFVDHALRIACSDGARREFELQPMSVADFYRRIMAALSELKIDVHINTMPSEVQDPVRFEEDVRHAAYDAKSVERFWRVLVTVCQIFAEFRSGYIGKVSPVHLFWGALDLAVTRFSGRRAPLHSPVPGVPDEVVQEDTHTRSPAPASGRADLVLMPRFTRTRIPNRRAMPKRECARLRPRIIRSCANTCCRTKPCAQPPRRRRP